MYTPVNPSSAISKWGARGYKSHGHVIMMAETVNDREFNVDVLQLQIYPKIAYRCNSKRDNYGRHLERRFVAYCFSSCYQIFSEVRL